MEEKKDEGVSDAPPPPSVGHVRSAELSEPVPLPEGAATAVPAAVAPATDAAPAAAPAAPAEQPVVAEPQAEAQAVKIEPEAEVKAEPQAQPAAAAAPAPPTVVSSLDPAQAAVPPTAVYQQPVSVPVAAAAVGAAPAPSPPVVQQQPGVTMTGAVAGAAASPGAQGGAFRQVKFENALDFLDEVKLVFANQPEVYNQFLDIMKEFKTKNIDTPGVIKRVKELFKGRPALVLGFNNFLPPGYKITLPLEGEPEGVAPTSSKKEDKRPVPPSVANQQAGGQAGGDGKQPEIDHARHFVKKIKIRFALHPSIYKAFLEILHLYHKGSHNIRDVYNQVAKLFQNHPDLLEEFAQFLPDTTGTATAPAAPEEKRRKATREKRTTQKRAPAKREPKERKERNTGHDDDEDSMSPSDRKRGRGAHFDTLEGTKEERKFLEDVQSTLNNTEIYRDFMKAFTLYSKQMVTRSAMMDYAKDLFENVPDLLERFRRFCNGRSGIKAARSVAVPHFTEMDFGALQRYGVSYRALPKMYRKGVCSGRTPEDQMVLNDTWVSVPTGKEDEQVTFRGALKNQYEEVLFQCEDDRYELDLVVELNASTIKFLEPIRCRMAEMTDAELRAFKLHEPLDVLHQRSIERLYGAEGNTVVDALYENPAVAVPVVLKRLKQKDREWRQNRREWDRIWREVAEKNQMRALDHESLGFKNTDKKHFTSKPLVAELQLRYQERLKDISQGKAAAREAQEEQQPHMAFPLQDSGILGDVEQLIMYALENRRGTGFDSFPEAPVDAAKAKQFFQHFMQPFFGYSGSGSAVGGAGGAEAGAAPEEAAAPAEAESGTKRKRRKQNAPAAAAAAAPAPAPIAPPLGDAKPMSASLGEEEPRRVALQTFYANKRFYVFFRVFALLCTRLRRAKELELNSGNEIWRPFNIIPSDKDAAEGGAQGGDGKYAVLLENLRKLLINEIDGGKYEDDAREMFGIHSYVLFTLDRLVDFLCRKLTSILTGDESVKLLGLWEYEQKRTRDGKTLEEPTYGVNAREVVGPRAKLIRLTFVDAKKAPPNDLAVVEKKEQPPLPPSDLDKELAMELLPSSLQPRVVAVTQEHEAWSKYVSEYVHGPAADLDPHKHRLFLRRNLKLTFPEREAALVDTGINNGIKVKISMSTYRMFYTAGTEDVFVRKTSSLARKGPSRSREAKFKKWLASLGIF